MICFFITDRISRRSHSSLPDDYWRILSCCPKGAKGKIWYRNVQTSDIGMPGSFTSKMQNHILFSSCSSFLWILHAAVPHPLHSLYLSECNFFLFSKLKIKLNRQTLDTTDANQVELLAMLNTLAKKRFSRCISFMEEVGISI